MKIKLLSTAVPQGGKHAIPAPGSQDWRAAAVSQTEGQIDFKRTVKAALNRIPPFMQLAAARAQRKLRITLPPIPRHPMCLNDRKTLATLHTAELEVWQASGGDFLHHTKSE